MYSRKDQRNLTRTEKKRLVDAILELKRSGRYDEFVTMHRQYYVTDAEGRPRAAHMSPSFFPWHRRYLLEFEEALQAVDPTVSIPYWDWTRDNTPAASLWAEDFLGGNGRSGDRQVMTGPFAYRQGNWRVSGGATDGRFLTRNFGRPSAPVDLPTAADVDRAMGDPVYDAAPWNSLSTTGFRNRIEGWGISGTRRVANHNQVHLWIGGSMAGAGSPDDPVFWLHHAYMDLLWARWQSAHPRSGYQPGSRLPDDDPQRDHVFAGDAPLPPWDETPSQLLDHTGVYEYV
ncbi:MULTISPECIES: tyrosinase family protein [Streptomyces]|uniref:Tyrosinase n=1 Tax=Streptomyces clavifer TaxID=68188 RepID=A0ABS4VHP3_9ACTN|nr:MULTISPECIES: tyrosinase family protein [Streptomyces]KQX91589.1 tyrosinase [Streptomyces sp. Root1319]KQZ20149.1 tyrosinase [Streptomyces sp. Root55]MBP2363144.1 tyrosinase [Streptomyces clavifer]MDX2743110.1 tyrosinase family protein [Streptomyces sp. NRRL_B-2557]MDX3061150.1 tyrosinase family protein [Streptomyces sp. ND04-05B]